MKANAPENYPMQFNDKIDEYLWKEHHILGGCCSSIESLKYTVAREVAEKLTDTFIEKASEWIKNKSESYVVDTPLCYYFDYKRAIEDFKEYIKGEKV
jgi:hypothetical protein